jgi:ferrous iron transport protein B
LDVLEQAMKGFSAKIAPRWLAVKLLESDAEVEKSITDVSVKLKAESLKADLEAKYNASLDTVMADQRYKYIERVHLQCVSSKLSFEKPLSSRIDRIVLNRFFGLPIFLLMMYLVFQLTFTVGGPLMKWVEALFGWIGDMVVGFWPEGSESMLKSLLVDGIIGGVGGVLVFLPNILLLFMAISILEDSGYMARAAFIMDRLMNKIGLHGKSFIPMLIGFGCSVPAIMAARTLDNKRDRLVTMLVVPLMSCGARLPIYALIIPAFFPSQWHAPMLWLIYIIGILLAILSAKLLRSTVFKGETVPFIMELPPYHVPTFKGTIIHMWDRGKLYIQKAGTVILGISILLWALSTFPSLGADKVAAFNSQQLAIESSGYSDATKEELISELDNQIAEASVENSYAGKLGKAIEPIIRPLGFDWRIGTSLVGAFAAKEVFVSTMGIVFSVGEADEESESLRSKLVEHYDPLIAFCIMLFSLISAPCMATIAVMKRESNSWKWALFQLTGLTLMAYFITLVVYQVGRIVGL